jgi:DNA-binding CsgD family transcriptional regulator
VTTPERTHDRIVELTSRGLDLIGFWRACTEAITPLIPHFLAPCWFTLDPATLLATSHHQEGIPEIPSEWLADEYYRDDYNKMADVVRSKLGASTLAEATGGDITRSARYREQMASYGVDQELVVGLRDRRGQAWGCLALYREVGQPEFSESEIDFLRGVSRHLAEGAQRALLFAEAREPDDPHPPGLVIFDEHWAIESMTPPTAAWFDEFLDGDLRQGKAPTALSAVAGRARRGGLAGSETAFSRVRTRSGGWVVLHGAHLPPGDRVAVIIEPAHPSRVAPLLMAAYQLTPREQDLTRLVLQGASTAAIAAALCVSSATVQQHLKGVFEKTSVRSRRELVGKLFFVHYEPRVRDNERRAGRSAPVRGGPAPFAP